MENDYSKMAQIYEGYRTGGQDLPGRNFKGRAPAVDYKNSFLPHGVASAGGADNAYAVGQTKPGGIESEESPQARLTLEEFCQDLRDRGQEAIANELALVIKQAFENDQ